MEKAHLEIGDISNEEKEFLFDLKKAMEYVKLNLNPDGSNGEEIIEYLRVHSDQDPERFPQLIDMVLRERRDEQYKMREDEFEASIKLRIESGEDDASIIRDLYKNGILGIADARDLINKIKGIKVKRRY